MFLEYFFCLQRIITFCFIDAVYLFFTLLPIHFFPSTRQYWDFICLWGWNNLLRFENFQYIPNKQRWFIQVVWVFLPACVMLLNHFIQFNENFIDCWWSRRSCPWYGLLDKILPAKNTSNLPTFHHLVRKCSLYQSLTSATLTLVGWTGTLTLQQTCSLDISVRSL